MSALQWLILIGCWLLAGIGWCGLFAAIGIRYQVAFEADPTTEADLQSLNSDLSAAA